MPAPGTCGPINSQSKEREVRFQVNDAGATAVLYHAALAPVVDAVRSELKNVGVFAVTGDAAPDGEEVIHIIERAPAGISAAELGHRAAAALEARGALALLATPTTNN